MKTPFLKLLILLSFSVLLLSVTVTAQWGGTKKRKIKSMPAVALPAEAAAEYLSGLMLAQVTVDRSGKVTSVKRIVGPDWTCPNYESPGLKVLRNYVEDTAKQVIFEPVAPDADQDAKEQWIEFKFAKAPKSDANEQAPKTLTVKGGVVNGKAISLPRPKLSDEARVAKVHGMVEVRLLIDEAGKVVSAEPVSGHPLLQPSARAAACSSRFSPTRLAGTPIKVAGVIQYNFL